MGWLLLPKRPVAGNSRSKAQALLAAVTIAASLAVFAVVQDRVTAAGARRYVALQRDASLGRGQPVTIQAVMEPAIRDSVRRGALAGGGVALVGMFVMVVRSRH